MNKNYCRNNNTKLMQPQFCNLVLQVNDTELTAKLFHYSIHCLSLSLCKALLSLL